MAASVKKVTIWRTEIAHQPGAMAAVLEPLAEAGADLQVSMAYAEGSRGFVEVFPISGRKVTEAARKAGLVASSKPTLLVEGDDRPGLGYSLARAIAEKGINISFVVAHTVGRKYSAVYGFSSDEDARVATSAIKKAAVARR